MSNELPPMWALDMAANCAGWDCWAAAMETIVHDSVIAHARTLAKYEKPPVDEAELKRRQDAREVAADTIMAQGRPTGAQSALAGNDDPYAAVQSAYRMACLKDGVDPIPFAEWGTAI